MTTSSRRSDLVLPGGRVLPSVDVTKVLEGREGRPPKSDWRPGPWHDEPDKIVWVDPVTNFDCMVVRNHLGGLCGYVGLPPGHPWHGLDYNECPYGEKCSSESRWCQHTLESQLDAHGGITFASACQEGGPICHVARRGRPSEVWWLGFDCAHAGDYLPGMEALSESINLPSPQFGGERYKDLNYVVVEVQQLALQCLVP